MVHTKKIKIKFVDTKTKYETLTIILIDFKETLIAKKSYTKK